LCVFTRFKKLNCLEIDCKGDSKAEDALSWDSRKFIQP